MGRTPKPRALKLLDGDQPCRINDQEPLPGDLVTVAPTMDLDRAAREVWDRLAPELISKKVLTSWDVDVFSMFCATVATYKDAARCLAEDGMTARGAAGGVIKSPYWQIMRDAVGIITTLGSRFGLTPADRTRLMVGGSESNGDGAERFLTG